MKLEHCHNPFLVHQRRPLDCDRPDNSIAQYYKRLHTFARKGLCAICIERFDGFAFK